MDAAPAPPVAGLAQPPPVVQGQSAPAAVTEADVAAQAVEQNLVDLLGHPLPAVVELVQIHRAVEGLGKGEVEIQLSVVLLQLRQGGLPLRQSRLLHALPLLPAAEELEKEGINCNLTLLFSFAQARACAEAGVFLISPFVGRIYDWYQARKPMDPYVVEEDPGVKSVRNIYDYYKQHHYETIVMGASFRRTEQILALTGCDRLTIAPNLLKELQEKVSPVVRKLIPPSQTFPRPAPMSEAEFRWEHNQDAMAVENLSEGIRLFAVDQRKLEDLLAAKL